MAYYRLKELVADADYHRLSLATEDEKIMFELSMNCNQDIIDDVIRILVDRDRIDRKLWEDESIIWMQELVESLKACYVNRRKPLPTKDKVSTCSNTEKRIEKDSKENIKESQSIENDTIADQSIEQDTIANDSTEKESKLDDVVYY